jgi:hypothetical protein
MLQKLKHWAIYLMLISSSDRKKREKQKNFLSPHDCDECKNELVLAKKNKIKTIENNFVLENQVPLALTRELSPVHILFKLKCFIIII